MKFVHTADLHFDTEFSSLSLKENLSETRRLEQRKIMKKIIDYCKENKIEILLIAGDLYEQKYIRKSSITYINELFKQIPKTKIFITPGNHDPYLKNSYYNTFEWSKNVHIFKDEIEKIELDENTNLYGFGFTDYYCHYSGAQNIILNEKNKTNILIIHGSLDGGNDDFKQYNPISSNKLKTTGFDYIALGHIHKRQEIEYENKKIVYPGSPISMGFDELGAHGMIVGNIEKGKIETKFIKLDDREFKEQELNITEMTSQEEIIEEINTKIPEDENLYKIILTGYRNTGVHPKEILKLTENQNIIKIKDHTKLPYNLEELKKENTIKGIYTRRILQRASEENLTPEETEKAIELGLEILKNQI